MDIDCSYFVGQHGQSAVDQGLVDEALIDARLTNLFKVRMRLQHFDPPGPLQQIPVSDVCSDRAAAIARDGAVQGAVLIKNEALPVPEKPETATGKGTTGRTTGRITGTAGTKTLPLVASALKRVAVIGPNANLSESMAGYYGPSAVCGGVFPSMIDAITSHLPSTATVTHTPGVPGVLSDDTTGVAAAAAMAKAADVTVLVLGTDTSVAMENHDAVNITFSSGQLALVAAVAAASRIPVVVVTLTAVRGV